MVSLSYFYPRQTKNLEEIQVKETKEDDEEKRKTCFMFKFEV